MKRLWAPWRFEYVTRSTDEGQPCVFCQALDPQTPSDYILHLGDHVFVVLNKYPYSNGHVMVVLRRHVGRMEDATPDELQELIRMTRLAEMTLTEVYHAHGINVGINVGRPAGAGVIDHLHVHLVPRWEGDTNFMSVVADTRVVPEDLATSLNRLKPVFERLVEGDR